MTKIFNTHVMLIKQNELYHNIIFFFSDDKTPLDKICKASETQAGTVWTKDDYPLIIKKVMVTHPENFKKYKYFFFRTVAAANDTFTVSTQEAIKIANMFTGNTDPKEYVESFNPHIKGLATALVNKKFEYILFDGVEELEIPDYKVCE
jgi:hypothetical protein